MPDVDGHARLLVPASVFVFKEMAEEPLLQPFAVAAVEMGEVRVAMHLEPFLFGAGGEPALEIARVCRPMPPQLPAESNGASILSNAAVRAAQ